MVNLGDRAVGSTLSFLFNTHKADGTPITLAGSPVVSVYKNSTTQSTSGVTLSVDYDSVTGMHQVIIDTSADGTFYATGNDFNVVVTTGTVNSISVVGSVVGKFSIGRQNISHAASVAWGSGAITAGAIATDAIGADEIAAGAVTKIQNGLATPTNITAGTITTVTNLTNAPTNGDLTAAMKASVNAEVDTALADIDLDHLSKTGSAPTPTVGSNLDKVMNKNASQTFDQSTDSLEAIADNAISGTIDANLISIDGELTTGNNAVLHLRGLDIQSDGPSPAVNIENTGGNAIYVNASIGNAVYINAQGSGVDAGSGIKVISAEEAAVKIEAAGTFAALDIYGEGDGISINGGSTAGHGINIRTNDINGDDLHLHTPSTNIGTPIDTTLSASHGSGNWDATATGTDVVSINGSVTAAEKLALSADTEIVGSIDASNWDPTTTVFETNLTNDLTNIYKDRWVLFTDGTLAGAARPILGYELTGGVGRITTTAFPEAPADEDAFIIV